MPGQHASNVTWVEVPLTCFTDPVIWPELQYVLYTWPVAYPQLGFNAQLYTCLRWDVPLTVCSVSRTVSV